MKNMMKYFLLVAVAAMGFACSEDQSDSTVSIPEVEMVEMTVLADADSRTIYDEGAKKAQWESTGEYIQVWETIAGLETPVSSNKSKEGVVDTDGKAAFEVSFTKNDEGAEFAYHAVYPASAVVTDNNLAVEKLKLITPAVQNATATSFDGAADLLISQPKILEAQPTELSLAFARMVAIGKMTLKNIDTEENILSVSFSSEGKVFAGRSYFNANTAEVAKHEGKDGYGYHSPSAELTINYAGGLANVKAGTPIYFTSLPTEIKGGESFTVTVSTASKKFTRTVTLPEDASIAFNAGRVSTFGVNMASATVEEISSLEGDYAVMAKNSTKIFKMGNQTSTYLTSNEDATLSAIPEQYKYLDESLVWTVVAGENDGQYYLQQKSSGKYVSWSSGNAATLATTPYALTIEKQEYGTYEVLSVNDATRTLQYNASNPRFAFYTGGQTAIYLVPAIPNTDPTLTVVAQPATVAAEGAEVTVELFTANLTEEIEVACEENWISGLAVADNTLTFTVGENTSEEERTATITLSANGVEATVEVKQSGKTTESTPKYVKVTSQLDDYTGTYLIVYETSKLAFDGSRATLDAVQNTKAVTITNGEIEATAEMNAIAFTIEGSQNSYAIKSASGMYIGVSSNSNGLKTTNTATTYKHSINYESGSTLIRSVFSGSTMALRYNNTSGQERFRYFKNAGQQPIQLYKLVEGTGGGETPEQKQDQTLSFSVNDETVTAVTATIGEAFTAPTLKGAMTTDVTYTSSNESVATVDATTGEVTLLAAGETTITAKAAETEDYNAAEASYELTVEAAQGGGGDEGGSDEPMTASISFSSYSGSMTNGTVVSLDSNITATFAKGGGTSNPALNSGYVRLYQKSGGGDGGTMTIACPSGMTISKIELTYSGTQNYFKVDTGTLSTDKKTWEGSASTVKFIVNGTSSSQRAYVGSIKVTYK